MKGSRRSTRNRKNRRSSRRQRGGVVLAPGLVTAPTVLLPNGIGGLVQGQQFAQQHIGQHGGAAPLSMNSALPSGMVDSAMQSKLLSALNEIKDMKDMAGGRRRKTAKKSRKGRKPSRRSRKAAKKSRKTIRKSRKASRRSRKQRGGQPAAALGDYMLGVEAKGTHPQFNNFAKL
jgi:hypothetical protein